MAPETPTQAGLAETRALRDDLSMGLFSRLCDPIDDRQAPDSERASGPAVP
ncbi:hypothetical protein [Amycolatopsis saalfeldensis]|uniref:Uncharacterized protein n=1 Tax=Amycolatopsis saalfeldensis TaxID=394193 RepID=A0A1H8Y321_9PSEU|nr:hypothetical protein [Amycolatopsis saalfeldensis]SEP46476.1 hypothetical protein SAMN04489732_110264 [Amycolatopsis saalfeldensis]